MNKVIVYGIGCPACGRTYDLINDKVKQMGIQAVVQKSTDTEELLKYGIMSVPAVMVNDQIVHVGGVPSDKSIESWFVTQK
jgi:small redox-active disulfide protein 2